MCITGAHDTWGSFSDIAFSILPQGPESMVSRQEVKPASPEPWGKRLTLEEGEEELPLDKEGRWPNPSQGPGQTE